MKTRRIFLAPGEPVEIINSLGISILKVEAKWTRTLGDVYSDPIAIIYDQPGVRTYPPRANDFDELTDEPCLGDDE